MMNPVYRTILLTGWGVKEKTADRRNNCGDKHWTPSACHSTSARQHGLSVDVKKCKDLASWALWHWTAVAWDAVPAAAH